MAHWASMGDTMMTLHEECLVDEAGNRKAVVLPLAAWQQIKEELEELEDIRASPS
jgi:PHD/YefM family antitoxin component YafN of YafNO toxin-antitoxin module